METIQILSPNDWQNYELLDSGNFEKLERFGKYILVRPEPQAVWDKSLSDKEWQNQAHAIFHKSDKGNAERGTWEVKKPELEQGWWLSFQNTDLKLQFKLSLSAYKHVGIFPEQAVNWNFIADKLAKIPHREPKVLNLFAYTGGASLAARQAGAQVTHVDSVKPVLTWARENMEASHLDNIRWIAEDALAFVRREVRRGNQYQGIILDPPAYGRGANGEKWVLEEQINEMLKLCGEILDKKQHFFILNLYSLGFSALIIENLLRSSYPFAQNIEIGELYLKDNFQKKLPLGVYGRFASGSGIKNYEEMS
ncbi:MAG: class I SAM-dependent methyltransferase [Microscillaceae bacterium]|jgi:23S rRNA (cytosine1962-C5)-methyltransferase|nr:class I SAM-dependent methyltransferase [Microscillaceae bacterium]